MSVSLATIVPKGCPIEKQCVQHLKNNGFNIKGNAKDLVSNSSDPDIGFAILLHGGWFGHVGLVYDYTEDTVCWDEINFLGCGIYGTRCLSRNDPSIRGYLMP